MRTHTTILEALGGEAGCKRLAVAFYARVGEDPVLRPLFPGKSHRCAIEEFTAFLIQFLGGDEGQTQKRWWLSLHESHARFQIGPAERSAWLKHMRATLAAMPLDAETSKALRQFFVHSSAYVVDKATVQPQDSELAARWGEQRILDAAIAAITAGRDQEVLAIVPRFAARPSVFVGLLTRMMKSQYLKTALAGAPAPRRNAGAGAPARANFSTTESGRTALVSFVVDAVEHDPSLATRRFAGKTLLHFAAGAGCLEVLALLLRLGTDPNIQDSDGHTPLYRVANECASETGPQIVRALVLAGADVNAGSGVTRATALHMAARRGHLEIARVLLDCGADAQARDRKGETPLQRAVNCRQQTIVQLLVVAQSRTTGEQFAPPGANGHTSGA